jgi:hypothetical protein
LIDLAKELRDHLSNTETNSMTQTLVSMVKTRDFKAAVSILAKYGIYSKNEFATVANEAIPEVDLDEL